MALSTSSYGNAHKALAPAAGSDALTHPLKPASGGLTRDSILACATQVFADKGFAGASVRDITQLAGANVAAVSYHFGDKASLYRAVFTEGFRKAPPLDLAWLPDQALALSVRLRRFFELIFELFACHEGTAFTRLLMREEVEPSGALGATLGDLIRPRHDALVAAFAQEIGCAPSHPRAHRVVKTLIDAVKGYFRGQDVLVHVNPDVFGGADWKERAIADLIEQAQDLLRGARWRVLRESFHSELTALSTDVQPS